MVTIYQMYVCSWVAPIVSRWFLNLNRVGKSTNYLPSKKNLLLSERNFLPPPEFYRPYAVHQCHLPVDISLILQPILRAPIAKRELDQFASHIDPKYCINVLKFWSSAKNKNLLDFITFCTLVDVWRRKLCTPKVVPWLTPETT